MRFFAQYLCHKSDKLNHIELPIKGYSRPTMTRIALNESAWC